MQRQDETVPRASKPTLYAVIAAMGFPTLLTWAYFVLLGDDATSLQQTVFGVGKVIQFGFPAVWVFCVLRERAKPRKPDRVSLAWGAGFGVIFFVVMLCLYHFGLKPLGVFQGPSEAIRAKVAGFGLSAGWSYFLFGAFYAVCHSGMEEYYWRWFVFRKLRNFVSNWPAIIISSLAFTAHHVILLGTFFGWSSPWAYFFSFCVAVGGGFWAWLYQTRGCIYGIWVSHALIDAAIFTVGYDVL